MVSSTISHLSEQTETESPQPWVLKAEGGLLVPTSRNKHPKPPPASRHRAVLSLGKDVPLFDMRANMEVGATSSRNARRPTMMVVTISTSRVYGVEDNPRYYELLVSFYSRRQVNDKNPSKFLQYKLIMPKDWTPRMYLGALNRSIKSNTVVAIESVTLEGRTYATTNELNWLFSSPIEVIHTRLTTSAAYLHVAGGKYRDKSS
jgi:hypothetical protein